MVDYLATVAEVKKIANLTNEYSNKEIEEYITDVEYEIFAKYPNFKKYSEITINSDYDSIYFIEEKNSIYLPYKLSIIREEDDTVEAGWSNITTTGWTIGTSTPIITVPTAVQTGSDNVKYRIEWVPKIFNRLTILTTYKRLLDNGIIMSNTSLENPTSFLVQDDINNIKQILKPKNKFIRSSIYENYNPTDYIEYEQYHTD